MFKYVTPFVMHVELFSHWFWVGFFLGKELRPMVDLVNDFLSPLN